MAIKPTNVRRENESMMNQGQVMEEEQDLQPQCCQQNVETRTLVTAGTSSTRCHDACRYEAGSSYEEVESHPPEEDDDNEEEEEDEDVFLHAYSRPIVVGYAFGPKKMITMGVVMAEASQAQIETSSAMIYLSQPGSPIPNTKTPATTSTTVLASIPDQALQSNSQSPKGTTREDRERMPPPVLGLTRAVLSTHNEQQSPPPSSLVLAHPHHYHQHHQHHHHRPWWRAMTRQQQSTSVSPSQAGCSSSSVADSSTCYSTGTFTASTNSLRTAGTSRPMSSSGGSITRLPTATDEEVDNSQPQHQNYQGQKMKARQLPIRVSFVPLDPDLPLEEQHGGKLDVILHKLTEDILCLSQLSMIHPPLKNLALFESMEAVEAYLHHYQSSIQGALPLTSATLDAIRRVFRLVHFQRQHPECTLVDDPVCVQILMSRLDIANTLQACLQNVTSTSGIPVVAPKSILMMLPPPLSPVGQDTTYNGANFQAAVEAVVNQFRQARLSFPVIVKPLIAAGTKHSHSMAILTDDVALPRLVERTPCMVQEYCNHDGILYKVYVLGAHVSVYRRRSLPNLPAGAKSRHGFLEFDSQKPYPRLLDFGYGTEDTTTSSSSSIMMFKKNAMDALLEGDVQHQDRSSHSHSPASPAPKLLVTVEEVKPIVSALKNAFGLELFGFDVLLTHNISTGVRQMMVVDVNYFPSYKENNNFPAMLAKYLTDRALEKRARLHTNQE